MHLSCMIYLTRLTDNLMTSVNFDGTPTKDLKKCIKKVSFDKVEMIFNNK